MGVYIDEKVNEIQATQPIIDGEGNERYRFLIDSYTTTSLCVDWGL